MAEIEGTPDARPETDPSGGGRGQNSGGADPREEIATLGREIRMLQEGLEVARVELRAFRSIFANLVRDTPLGDELLALTDDALVARGLRADEVAYLRKVLSPLQNFSWVIPDRLAGCAIPHAPASLRALAEAGVRTVVTLTPAPLPADDLAAAGIVGVHVPVPDREAPAPERLAEAVAAIDRSIADGRPVAVHCAAGFGRTGTVIAAYLIFRGMPVDEAIAEVRQLRPRSIESVAQEAAVREYGRRLGRSG